MRQPGWRSGVLTFANHPATHLAPGNRAAVDLDAARAARSLCVGRFRRVFLRARSTTASRRSTPQAFLDILVERLRRCAASPSARPFASDTNAPAMPRSCASISSERGVDVRRAWSRSCTTAASASRARESARSSQRASWRRPTDAPGGTGYEIRGPSNSARGAGTRWASRPLTFAFRRSSCRRTASIRPSRATTAATTRRSSRSAPIRSSAGSDRTVEAWLRDFQQIDLRPRARPARAALGARTAAFRRRRRTRRADAARSGQRSDIRPMGSLLAPPSGGSRSVRPRRRAATAAARPSRPAKAGRPSSAVPPRIGPSRRSMARTFRSLRCAASRST